MDTASKIMFINDIMPKIESVFIKNGESYIITPKYDFFREALTLYAKQHNLVEATLVLLENNMNEEAIVLARSILNNYFLIGYILSDDNQKSNLKEYQIQPLVSERYHWENVREVMRRPIWGRMIEQGKSWAITEEQVEERLESVKQQIIAAGYPSQKRPLSIKNTAKFADDHGLELYFTYYTKASKYEHSDISTLSVYKDILDEEYSTDIAFGMNLNRTDETLKDDIVTMISISYLDSLVKLSNLVIVEEPHLRGYYDVEYLTKLMEQIAPFIYQL